MATKEETMGETREGKTSKTTEVRAFACGMCQSVHATRKEADECCSCMVCHGKFAKRTSYTSTCDGCSYGTDLREARANLRRATENLANAKERLERLLAGRPAKARREIRQ